MLVLITDAISRLLAVNWAGESFPLQAQIRIAPGKGLASTNAIKLGGGIRLSAVSFECPFLLPMNPRSLISAIFAFKTGKKR
jgi:hypothetical protein